MAFPAQIDLADLNGNNGFTITGVYASDYSGSIVSDAGDVNGDGFDDVVIFARRAGTNFGSARGKSYVVFGNGDGFNRSLGLEDLDGSNGFVIAGSDTAEFRGTSVSGAGDINSDGFDDIIVAELNPT
ncbi:MAG: integrin alpha [Cyanobacteria bacterium P01_D01_bin.36]